MVYDSCPGVRDMADGSRTRSRRVLILTCVHCDGTANRLVESAYASAFLECRLEKDPCEGPLAVE
jgi:hypothetical protein